MKIINRHGISEDVDFNKITNRITNLNHEKSICDPIIIAQQVVSRIKDGATTSELDDLSSSLCIEMTDKHPDYGRLGATIAIDNHHKNTKECMLKVIETLYNNTDRNEEHAPIINDRIYKLVKENKDVINDMFDFDRDFLLDFFGMKTLQKSYLLRLSDGKIIERPQHLFMRVALAIHHDDFINVKETYDMMSNLLFIHATPTLFHAGCVYEQLSSCFLLITPDSVDGIYDTLKDVATISKWAGGIGKSISDVRAKNSYIRKTGGKGDGIMPLLKVENATARYINQSGKRLGSFAEYIEPWHADILTFLNAKKNHGNEDERARDLFYGLWIPDAFMRAVEKDDMWYLMCPDECQGLTEVYGEEFDKLYDEYILRKKYRKVMKARDLFFEITTSQKETGLPYMLYKDACNRKSNQKNKGTIKCSNLCTEIIEYSDEKEYAVCNLGSIALSKCIWYPEVKFESLSIYTIPDCNWCLLAKGLAKQYNINTNIIVLEGEDKEFVKQQYGIKTFPYILDCKEVIGGFTEFYDMLRPYFDFDKLKDIVKVLTRNLNKIIDVNFYPLPQTKLSNMNNRPIGIGVQGLADIFIQLGIAFDSEEARELNRDIFENIYYYALETSCEIAKDDGVYPSYSGSPISKGIFQHDMWKEDDKMGFETKLDWEKLRGNINEGGVRNSLLVAPMPTASTAQILGNNECFEPYTSNLYTRRTLSGEFLVANKWLYRDLINMGLWNDDMRDKLMYYRGSIQNIKGIPKRMKDLYKTAWEMKQKVLVDLAADRGVFIDQSQSLNVFMASPTHSTLTKYHIYAWKKGLKTGSYYIRSKPSVNSQQFTVDPGMKKRIMEEEENNYETCEMCSA